MLSYPESREVVGVSYEKVGEDGNSRTNEKEETQNYGID